MKTFIEFLNEKTDNCQEIFEKFVFGQVLGKDEPDTNTENIHWKNLYTFIRSNRADGEVVKTLESLYDCKEQYNELKPTAKMVYRGTEEESFIYARSDFTKPNKDGWCKSKKTVRYTGHSGSQVTSWSTDMGVAIAFAVGETSNFYGVKKATKMVVDKSEDGKEWGWEGMMPVIYEMNPKNARFLFNSDFSGEISRKVLGRDEKEVVCLDKSVEPYILVHESWMQYLD